MDSVLKDYLESLDTVGRMFGENWKEVLQSLGIGVGDDPLQRGTSLWSYSFPDLFKAEVLIRDTNLEQKLKEALIEQHRATVTQFKATPEFQKYLETRETALKIMETFKSFLKQWTKKSLSLFAR